ncbi:C40 family peptidase [Arenimonas sp.]|uniref:C40 family peptidase n=1 Tax=Arenimonas sp. TaxID=1872635 RepID=UPI002D1FB25F|nr:C40 family peptidase [Arenimonas sp.]
MRDAHYPQPSVPTLVFRGFFLLWLALQLSACASSGGSRTGTGDSQSYGLGEDRYREPGTLSALSNDVLMRAIGLVGTPYRYGGSTPEGGFDCSGLVGFVFRDAAGLKLPRSTRELIDLNAPKVDRDDLQPGDLVFFNPRGGRVSHIGIYVGEGRFVHAPATGGTVRLDSLESAYWRKHYVSAKRIIN